jgi:uncharacterized protein YjbI with pentapeptide repeats
MKFEIKHRFTGAILFSLETESMKLCVEAAVKVRANLGGAYLEDANLKGADLGGANLARANLAVAYLAAHLGYPNGWSAFAWVKDNQVRVQVGCRNFTLAEGRAYWAGQKNRREVLAALDYAERIADLRGWIKEDRAAQDAKRSSKVL